MKKLYNLIMVLDQHEKQVLMCFRATDPYKGKYNLLGGKIDDGEDYLDSAYRELEEESGITKKDILLKPFIDYTWHSANTKMKVFIGKLKHDVTLVKEVHELHWMDMESNFFDTNTFAGEGNIGHMVRIYQMHRNYLEK